MLPQAFERDRPPLRKTASSADPSEYANTWKLGNVHNFPILVNTMLLFAPGTDKLQWTPQCDYLKENDCVRIYKLAGNAAEAALSSHKSMTTDPGPNSDNFGVFRYRADATGSGSFDEQRLSLAFTNAFDSFITKACSQDAVISGAREQYDECKNSQDYVLNRRLSGGTLPLVVIEFATTRVHKKITKRHSSSRTFATMRTCCLLKRAY